MKRAPQSALKTIKTKVNENKLTIETQQSITKAASPNLAIKRTKKRNYITMQWIGVSLV